MPHCYMLDVVLWMAELGHWLLRGETLPVMGRSLIVIGIQAAAWIIVMFPMK